MTCCHHNRWELDKISSLKLLSCYCLVRFTLYKKKRMMLQHCCYLTYQKHFSEFCKNNWCISWNKKKFQDDWSTESSSSCSTEKSFLSLIIRSLRFLTFLWEFLKIHHCYSFSFCSTMQNCWISAIQLKLESAVWDLWMM